MKNTKKYFSARHFVQYRRFRCEAKNGQRVTRILFGHGASKMCLSYRRVGSALPWTIEAVGDTVATGEYLVLAGTLLDEAVPYPQAVPQPLQGLIPKFAATYISYVFNIVVSLLEHLYQSSDIWYPRSRPFSRRSTVAEFKSGMLNSDVQMPMLCQGMEYKNYFCTSEYFVGDSLESLAQYFQFVRSRD